MARKRTRRNANPFALGMDAWLVGAEAASVIALRSARLALGGAEAQLEAQRMVSEKAEAAWELGLLLATGGLGVRPETVARRTVAHYGKPVRANQRPSLARRFLTARLHPPSVPIPYLAITSGPVSVSLSASNA